MNVSGSVQSQISEQYMLIPFHAIEGCSLATRDGNMGKTREFYFDDRKWRMRYLVVRAGTWLSGRVVLIAPAAVEEISLQENTIVVNLTQEQVRNSPPMESDLPVSRQYEAELHRHYDWPPYWNVEAISFGIPFAPVVSPVIETEEMPPEEEVVGDSHLRSSNELLSDYTLHTHDGEIGRISDLIVEDGAWFVRYLVIHAGVWFFGKEVLLAPEWIHHISHDEKKVFVNLPRALISGAPPYDSQVAIGRTYEQHLHDHYGRKGYWTALEESRRMSEGKSPETASAKPVENAMRG